MRTNSIRIVGFAVASLTLASSAAFAQGRGNGQNRTPMQILRGGGQQATTRDGREVERDDDQDQDRAHDRDHDRDHDRKHEAKRERKNSERQRGENEGQRRDADRQDRRVYGNDNGRYDDRYDDRYDNGRRIPPGLAKKPGQMPPGQYKKRYGTNQGASVLGEILGRNGYSVLRTVPQNQSQYVYYRLRDGSERRAIVSPGTDRLSFSNVPQSILQQVLSALY